MKKGYLSFLIASLLFAGFGCKKTYNMAGFYNQTIIETAKNYFIREVSDNSSPTQINSDNSQDNTNHNPRKILSKTPVWEKAYTTQLSVGEAVVVPVRFKNPFIIKSNFGGNKFYSVDDLTNLLIYKDVNGKYHAEVVTSLPDSSYLNKNHSPFSGIAIVEDWSGNLVNRFKYLPGRKTMKYNTILAKQAATASDRLRNELAAMEIIQVCYEIYGYNYSVEDPDTRYYWSESCGCSSYFVDDEQAADDNLSGGDYGGIGGGGGSGASGEGISVANEVTVLPGGEAIINVKNYNKCFDNIPGSVHSYQVSVCVSQPNPGSRDPWTFSNPGGSSNTGNPFFVGHTFLVLSETAPSKSIVRNVGFYPAGRVNPYTPSTSGSLNNDESHDYNISLTVNVTSNDFTSLLNFIEQANSSGYLYNLNSNNCTTFAINALSNIGVNLPRTTGTWLNGAGLNPGDLGEDIRQMNLESNMTRSTGDKPHLNKGTCN